MLTKTRLVGGATGLLLAALPSLVAATPSDATPSDAASPTRAVAAGDPDVTLTTFEFADVVMSREFFDGFTYFVPLRGTIRAIFRSGVGWQGTAYNPVTVSLKINGRPAAAPFNFVGFNFTNGARTSIQAAAPNYLGAGRWTVGPVSLAIVDNGVERSARLANTDTFFVRRPSLTSIGARRSGPVVTLSVRAQVRDARTWKAKSARRAVVERKVGSSWQLVRKVRVNAAGKAQLRVRSPQRFIYRVKVKQTATTAGSSATTRGRA